MGVTAYLTTDLASIPLMWIIPLALYLLSFILAFARLDGGVGPGRHLVASLSHRATRAGHACRVRSPFVDSPSSDGVFRRFAWPATVHWPQLRPPARNLSVFYVTIALGGLLGGTWNALVAPLIFDRVVEYPLVLVLACLVAPGFKTTRRSTELGRTGCGTCSSRESCSA